MTESQAAKLVAVLIAAYQQPQAKLDQKSAAIYERMLMDLDYMAASAAVERLLATSKWPPSIAEIREATASLQLGEVAPGGEAWGKVLRAIGKYGRNRVPTAEFFGGDEVALDAVRALSWRELCDSENQAADRARFIELYDKLAEQTRRKQLSAALPAMQRFREIQAKERRELPAAAEQSGQAEGLVRMLAEATRRSQ